MKLKGISSFVFVLMAFQLMGQTTLDRIKQANELYYAHPDSSYFICKAIEEKLKNTRNVIEIAEAQLCQARFLLLKTRFEECTSKINSALAIFEQEGRTSSLAKCHSLKAILLDRISNTAEAIYHQRKALDLYSKINDVKGQVGVLTNISLDFLDIAENDSALFYLKKLASYEDEMRSTSKYFMHQNFANYYYNIGEYDQSIASYKEALKVAEAEHMIDSKATCLMLMGVTYLAKKDYNKAEQLLYQSVDIAQEHELLHEANEAYVKLIKLYELKGDYKKAYDIDKLNDKIEEEIYNLDKINKINEIESQLKLTEKEAIIAQKELDIKSEQLNTIEAKSRVTQLFYLAGLFLVIIVFVVFILVRARKLNAKINLQRLMLEEKNTEITDSINYAKRIQDAILPSSEFFKSNLPASFILYKPKDIVAGDFYWMHTEGDTILYAAADCTGHGVPGAMVSVVCSNALNHSLKKLQSFQPNELLEETRVLVKDRFNKGNDLNVKDGMDIALCAFNKTKKTVQFAGANNPLWIVRRGELIEIRGDKQPVGQHFKEKPFTHHETNLETGDMLYVFSDGYADQFGGPKGKKFMYGQLKKLVLSIADKPLEEQHELLDTTFENWKGELEQLDDVVMIGMRV